MIPIAELSSGFADLVARAAPGVVGVEHRRGLGSGVVLAPDGSILTNAHVAAGPGPLRVRLSGARTVKGELAGTDARTDLAVVRADAGDLPALRSPSAASGSARSCSPSGTPSASSAR